MSPAPFTSPLAQAVSNDVLERFLRYVRIDTQSSPRPHQLPQHARPARARPAARGGAARARPRRRRARRQRLRDGHASRSGGRRPERSRSSACSPTSTPARTRRGRAWSRSSTVTTTAGIELPRQRHPARPGDDARAARKVGHDIVTSSGDTLLGADDKAGVATIMAAVAHLPRIPSCRVRRCGSPSPPTRRSARAPPCSTSSALARSAPTRSTGPSWASSRTRPSARSRRWSRSRASTSIPGRPRASWSTPFAWPRGRGRAARRPLARDDLRSPGFIHPSQLTGTRATASFRAIMRDFDEGRLAEHLAVLERDRREASSGPEPRAKVEGRGPPPVQEHARPPRPSAHVTEAAAEAIRAEGIEPVSDPDPGRHRRLEAERDGPAHAQPLHRRS